MNFKQEKLYAIAAYTLAEKEGIKGVAFVATNHSFSLVCELGPIGAKMTTPDGWRTSDRGGLNGYRTQLASIQCTCSKQM